MHAHLSHEPDAIHLEELRAALDPSVTLTVGEDIDPATQILIAGRPTRIQLDGCSHLEAVLIPWAGLPDVTREVMRDYPQVRVHNLHHNAVMTVEMALALLLAAAKIVVPVDRSFRRHDWTLRYDSPQIVILDGKTVLVLGYGAIGQRVGEACKTLGMHVLGIRRNATGGDIFPPDKLHDLLPQANVLVVCLPGTDETTGLIGEHELSLLPRNAIVVNVGRGPVIDQHALYAALKEGRLHSAGLDVWYTYPEDEDARANTPPADVPFHELDNVVMSPHRAGGGGDYETGFRQMSAIAHSLNAAATSGEMPHRVDVEAGY